MKRSNANVKISLAFRTFENQIHATIPPLKKGGLSVLVICCTKIMDWLSACHVFLQAISKNSRSQFLQFIALFLCFPCFKVGQFFFKVAYFLNQRRALIISRKYTLLGLDNRALQFEDLSLKGRSITYVYHRLRDVYGRIQRVSDDADCCDVNHL